MLPVLRQFMKKKRAEKCKLQSRRIIGRESVFFFREKSSSFGQFHIFKMMMRKIRNYGLPFIIPARQLKFSVHFRARLVAVLSLILGNGILRAETP
jgi:hypothetical protein